MASSGLVQKFFSGYAAKWDSLYGKKNGKDPFSKFVDEVLRKVIKVRFDKCVEIVKRSGSLSVLDVGCGSGRYLEEFAQSKIEVLGIDFAETMLEIARKTIEEKSLGDLAQIQNVSWDDYEVVKEFDAVIAIGFFDYQENASLALNKMAKLAKKVVVASFPRNSGVLAIQRRVRYRRRKCPLWMYSKADVETLARGISGLRNFNVIDLGRDFLLVLYK